VISEIKNENPYPISSSEIDILSSILKDLTKIEIIESRLKGEKIFQEEVRDAILK